MYRKKKADRLISWMFIAAPFMRFNGASYLIPISAGIYDIWMIVSFVVLIYKLIWIKIEKKAKGIDWSIIMIALFYIYILVPTYINHGNYREHLRIGIICVGLAMITSLLKDTPKLLFNSISTNLEIMIYINTICMVLYPDGMYLSRGDSGSPNCWLMGYDNHWFVFYYVSYFLAIINIIYFNKKFRGIIMIVTLHITSIYTFSGVLLFGILLFDLILVVKFYKRTWFTTMKAMIIGIGFSWLFVFFSQTNIVQFIFTNIFGKSETASSRTIIWEKALSLIQSSPITGSGRRFLQDNRLFYNITAAGNAHNNWLEILAEGGVIAFVLFVVLVIVISRPKGMLSNDNATCKFYRITVIPLFVMFMAMSMDSMLEVRGVMLFWVLSVAYHSTDIEQNLIKKNDNIYERMLVK